MATTTILVTTNADGSVNVSSAATPAFGAYIPGPTNSNQIKRIWFAIKDLLETVTGGVPN